MYSYPDTIANAAKILDENCPDWFRRIKKEIDMGDELRCILGQVYGDYVNGFKQLFGKTPYHQPERYSFDRIFGANSSVACWQSMIDDRIQKAAINSLPPLSAIQDTNKESPMNNLSFMEAWPYLDKGKIIEDKNGYKYKLSCGILCSLDNVSVAISYSLIHQKYKVCNQLKKLSELKDRQRFVHDSYTYTTLVPAHKEYNCIDRYNRLQSIDHNEEVEVLE